MSLSYDEILKLALTLSESDRVFLATKLYESVGDPMPGLSVDDPDFEAELRRRSNDPAPGVNWLEIKEIVKHKIERNDTD